MREHLQYAASVVSICIQSVTNTFLVFMHRPHFGRMEGNRKFEKTAADAKHGCTTFPEVSHPLLYFGSLQQSRFLQWAASEREKKDIQIHVLPFPVHVLNRKEMSEARGISGRWSRGGSVTAEGPWPSVVRKTMR